MKTIKKFEIRSQRISVDEHKEIYNQQINNPDIVENIVRQLTSGIDQEKLFVFLLDIKNKIIGFVEAHSGGIDNCNVDPRIIFRAAVHLGASGIIISHNHPSGDSTPSNSDNNLTTRISKCGKLLDIIVLDHIILGNEIYSYKMNQPYLLEN